MLEFKELKVTYDQASSAISKGQEPTEQLVALQRYLQDLAANHSVLMARNKERADALPPDQIRYILEDLSPGLIRKMCRERSRDDHYLQVCGAVLEAFIDLLILELKSGNFNQDFLFACRQIFDYDCMLHKFNFQIPEETLQALITKGTGQAWRKALQAGDQVDAVLHYYDRSGASRGSGWTRARISKVEGDALHLEYPTETRDADRVLDRWSVEIAEFESKTLDSWRWKQALKVDDQIDALDDSFKWLKATIIKIEQREDKGRVFEMATVGMRVYVASGPRHDERGSYEGWGDRFDEKIPLYSPRLCPFLSRSGKTAADADDELDESLDDVMAPLENHARVWAVPRPGKCTSSEYVRHVSAFCERGGLESVLTVLDTSEASDKPEGFNLCVLAILLSLASLPALVYHKSVIAEFAPQLIAVSKRRLLSAPDRALRDVRREHIEAIVKAVDCLSRRITAKGEREKQLEVLKLEVALLCLNSSYMERRIQGIRDLTAIIKSNRVLSAPLLEGRFLVEWMQTHGVFDVLFAPKKTHLQLVQRCDEILKLLLQEDMLSEELLQLFWGLTRTDLRLEVYKIISDCAFYFKQKHLDFLFGKIKHEIPPEKLGMEEFACLSELGKYGSKEKGAGFSERVAQFFWDLIVSKETKSLELIENCIQKYRDMVRYWDLEKKQALFTALLECLRMRSTPTLPCLQLLQGLIQDQSERGVYSPQPAAAHASASASGPSAGPQAQGASTYGGTGAGGSALRARPSEPSAPQDQPQSSLSDVDGEGEAVAQPVLTLQGLLKRLVIEQGLIGHLLADLAHYCEDVHQHCQGQAILTDREKLHVLGSRYSHHSEIAGRLQFLKFVAQISADYCISKKELGVIYDLLVTRSCVESDQQEFLTWCKSSCESHSAKSAILDLGEVGEFFTEKIACGELDVSSLAPVGFEFLQFYFISLNEREGNLSRQGSSQSATRTTSYPSYSNATGKWTTSYSWNSNQGSASASKTEEPGSALGAVPVFTLQRLPSELRELDMLWTLVLGCEQALVVPRVIDFLIKVHLQLCEDLKSQRLAVLRALIDRCMAILSREAGKDTRKSVRVLEILKTLVHVTEVNGTGDVLAHGALLRGEPLEALRIRNRATLTGGELVVQVNSNNSLWDLRKEVARALDLAPRQLQLSLGTGQSATELKDVDNGKTIAALGLAGGEVLTAQKLALDEHVPNAALIGPDGELTPPARRIFSGWYDRFCDAEGAFTRDSAAHFIQACCGDLPAPSDQRITALFQTYDGDGDGKIQREEFLSFYRTCSRGEKAATVRENLKAFNVRPDLKRMSEVVDEEAPSVEELPRHFMPRDQAHFDLLMGLLDVGDKDLAVAAWELIQMLATNRSFYSRVLQLDIAKQADSVGVDWDRFLDRSAAYRLLYTIQIVQAVLEDDDDSQRSVSVLNAADFPGGRKEDQNETNKDREATGKVSTDLAHMQSEELNENRNAELSVAESSNADAVLRAQWAEAFLLQGGFSHILRDFMACTVPGELDGGDRGANQSVELKYLAFMLHLLRTFIMAAFSTRDADAYQAATLARRSSSVRASDGGESPEPLASEGTSFTQLKSLLAGPIGIQIVELVDYSALQRQVLRVTSQVLRKGKLLFEDKLIVENALNLWVGCLLHRSNLFAEFLAPRDPELKADELLLAGLLHCPYETVREQFKQSLSALCSRVRVDDEPERPSPLESTLKLLSQNFQQISEYPCKQYFELFCELLDKHFLDSKIGSKSMRASQVIDSESLLSAVIDRIREENMKAQRARAEGTASGKVGAELKESAGLFQGLIQLAGKILDNCQDPKGGSSGLASDSGLQQRGLIQEIFTRFLFPTVFDSDRAQENRSLTMTQAIESRAAQKSAPTGAEIKGAAYRLLNSLLRRDSQLMDYFLRECLEPLMAHIQRTSAWNYTPPSASERSQRFVGLRNLGCICYMNSMLQQFFMIPALRYNLLCVEDQVPEDLKEYKGELVDDNVLHQLQKLMANLELSERADYDPWQFCFAFKEFDGAPTNTGEQKDAQEFLNLAFDRLENALKGTSRQHLLQSVFGGQTCSQLVCKACGKVKNRLEDFYNLSLTVKDIKGMHESLAKLVEGELISDYECSGCKQKVDVSKRTLIAQTPNVLIVHLQRIVFNFDTFQNDKLNQHFEFPQELDLTPYSYYQVMGGEGRLGEETGSQKSRKSSEEGVERDQDHKETEANAQTDAEADGSQVPAPEDCFEYKLVGVTVHSGTAHAGHYWSYINTRRGREEEVNGSSAWGGLEGDCWMEFNDSTVRDFQSSKLKEECFGGDGGGSGGFGLSSMDGWGLNGGYGKSGYMLFYERKQKKPLKLLPAAPVPTGSATHQNVGSGEKGQDQTLEVDYLEAVLPSDRPNKLYLQVLDENRKFGFENDIYSKDFFDFTLTLQKDILAMETDEQLKHVLRKRAVSLGSKAALELLAKAFSNSCIDEHVAVLLKIIRSDSSGALAAEFLASWYHEDGFDYLFALLLECPDTRARTCVATLLKHVLVVLKMKDQHCLLEPEEFEVEGDNGTRMTMQRYKALSSRFMEQAMGLLNSRVAKNWSRFDQFHELILFYALADLTDLENLRLGSDQAKNSEPRGLSATSAGARAGLEFFFAARYIERASDFMLGKKSPLCAEGERRPDLGGSYAHPDFSSVIKLLTAMITDSELSQRYPMTELVKSMILHPDLLKTMLGSATASKQFGQCLANMCRDNSKLSRKVTKVFLRSIEQAHLDTVKGYLKALKPFLRADDSLKQLKLEWVFGVPEVISRKIYGADRCKYGLELVDRVNEEAIKFTSPILAGGAGDEALIAQIVKCKGRFDVQCISCLKELLSLMRKDREIALYVYNLPPWSYQSARFTDWFRPYLEEQLNDPSRASASTNQYFKNKFDLLAKAVDHLDALAPVFAEFEREQLEKLEKCMTEGGLGFTDLSGHWAGANNSEVIKCFPPQLIVGRQVADDKEILSDDSHPLVRVDLYELACEYAYSAPTGLYNLQIPHVEARASLYQTQSYLQYKRAQVYKEQDQPEDSPVEGNDEKELAEYGARHWDDWKEEGPVMLKVVLTNKTKDKDLKIWFKISYNDGAEGVNVPLPVASKKTYLYAKNQKIIQTLLKVDPTKRYFFKSLSEISFDIDVKVRNEQSPEPAATVTRHVQYANAEAGQSNNDYDEDDRDDEMAYMRYQQNPNYEGYVGAAGEDGNLMGLLNIQPQDDGSNDSTNANQGGVGQNSDIDMGGLSDDTGVKCSICNAINDPTEAYQCSECGNFIGGTQ